MIPNSPFLRELLDRGSLHQCTDLAGLDDRLCAGPAAAYVGFDATAASLHIGHLLPILALRRLQKHGHRPIVLIGGATTRVGDPSFRDTSRPLLDDQAIAANKAGIANLFSRFLSFEGEGAAVMLDNADWLDPLGWIDALRDFGVHFTVNRMLSFDSVKTRLAREEPLTLLEFNYMVMQAYDFRELARKESCILQMGGSDQWGNIVNGIELARKTDGAQLFGLTTPLLSTSSGQKMGKTATGAVWLDSVKTSPYDFWQFWRDTNDADTVRFLKLFTSLEAEELQDLEAGPVNEAKVRLADDVTALVHGQAAASDARARAEALFAGRTDAHGGHPIAASRLAEGIGILDLFVETGLAGSKGEARRLIRDGGAKVHGEAITDETMRLRHSDLRDGAALLSAGRKRHAVVRPA